MDSRKNQLPLGGMNEAIYTEPGVAEQIVNMYRDPEGMWVVMEGSVPVTTSAPGSGAVSSIGWFNPRPAQSWLVYERAVSTATSSIRFVDFVTLATEQITTRRRVSNADPGSIFAENARWLYIFSPVDAPIRWNGLWKSAVGFDGPAPAPDVAGPDQGFDFVDKLGGTFSPDEFKSETKQRGVGPYPTDEETVWKYGYALTQVNELGQESPPSSIVYASGTNSSGDTGGRKMVFVAVPRLPDHVRGSRLYRTRNLIDEEAAAIGLTLYLVAEFPTASPFQWLDLTPDDELVVEFDRDSVGPIPLGARAAAFWQGGMWLGGCPDDPTRLRFSHPLFPEQFPVVNYLPVGSSRTGPIVALYPIPRGLVVFKTGGVYVVKGQPGNYRVETVSEQVGCAAPRAIEYVIDLGLVFLARSGPHVLRGTLDDDKPSAVMPLTGIRKTWRTRAGVELACATVVYQPEFDELWFHIPQGGGTRNTLGIVYHMGINQWSLRSGWSVSCFGRGLGRTWFGSWDDTDSPGLHLLTFGSAEHPDGDDVVGRYQPGYLQFPEATVVLGVEVWGKALGPVATLAITTQVDRRPATSATDSGKEEKVNSWSPDVWGTGVWSTTELWGDYYPDRFRVNLRMAKSRDFGVAFVSDAMAIAAMRVEVKKDQSSVEPEGRP